MMYIGIVIPLKAKAVSKNWDMVCKNLKRTVTSILAQSSTEFSAIVVGHDKPDFLEEIRDSIDLKGSCYFLPFNDFPPPTLYQNDIETNQLRYESDRCNKILKGIMHLSKNSSPAISHWFALDADDLLSNVFVETLPLYEGSDAIVLDNGYFLFNSTGIINEENSFSAYCGSSAILSNALMSLPDKVTSIDSYKKAMPYGSISHVFMKDKLTEVGLKVVIPEKRIIMYVRDNGENISKEAYGTRLFQKFKKYVKMLLKFKFRSAKIKEEFGLTRVN